MLRAGLVCVVCAACGFQVPTGLGPDAARPDTGPPIDGAACGAVQVVAGGDHTCARMTDGSLYCWGRAASGELGVAGITTRCTVVGVQYPCSPVPLRVNVPATVSLGLGSSHTCASTTSGTYCWGLNSTGDYGDATTTSVATPTKIAQRDGAGVMDAGRYHTCSVGVGGLSCSGGNISGEVGDNSMVMQTTATLVMADVKAIGLGDYLSCAIDSANLVWCWGRNAYKEIDPSGLNKLAPTAISGIAGATQVAAGLDHVCAVLDDHTAKCWGSNTRGELGNGMTSTAAQPPTTVSVPNIAEVSADRAHTCVRDGVGQVWCMGEGYAVAPTQILLPRAATSLTTGSLHDCAITDDRAVWCWGNEDLGQLGNGVSAAMRVMAPQQVKICP